MKRVLAVATTVCVATISHDASAQSAHYPNKAKYDALVAHHARINNVPESLVHRVIVRESKYQPHLIGRGGAMGMMQIKLPTARGVGYSGTADGLLNAETNVTYATRYLAGAWRLADGSHDRAVSHYARGYYYAAKAAGVRMPSASRVSTGPQQLQPKEFRRAKFDQKHQSAPRFEELASTYDAPKR